MFFFSTTPPDDIRLTQLFVPGVPGPVADNIDKKLIAQLATDYGSGGTAGTPCWEFNKMLAHPTTARGLSYDYTKALVTLGQTIEKILKEIEALRKVTFPPIVQLTMSLRHCHRARIRGLVSDGAPDQSGSAGEQ